VNGHKKLGGAERRKNKERRKLELHKGSNHVKNK
jgi:hypothetical protein